jgi:secreted trypsin-like serine protease
VRLLEHSRVTSNEASSIDRRVQRVVVHSGYDEATFNNDIALLRLDSEVTLQDRLRPVCLPTPGATTT